MWSVLSEIENPALRITLFACVIPLMWFALLTTALLDAAGAPARAFVRKR